MDILALVIAVVLILYLMQVGFPRTTRQLSASRSFLRFYFHRLCSSWVLLASAGLVLLHDGIPLASIGLLLPNPWWPTVLACIGVGVLFSLLLVIHLRAWSDGHLVARLALPPTPSERLAWVGVSVNAGIWEEIVFRGFLPWDPALLYALTGNILASITRHFLVDVRFSFGAAVIPGTTQRAVDGSPDPVDEGGPRPGPGIWQSRQQRRWHLHEDWKAQPRWQEEPTPLDTLKTALESSEAGETDASPGVSERPVRGRAAREQRLRDMGE